MRSLSTILLIIAVFFIHSSSSAQRTTDSLSQPHKKVGVALSGGGAKGFAHIGVLKVMEEVGLQIDYISGTSMGSIVGGLYAIGYTAEDLEDIALNTDWQLMFNERPRRRFINMTEKQVEEIFILNLPISRKGIQLPEGLISGQNVYELLSELTWSVHAINNFSELPIPFRCIATNLETGEAVVLNEGFLPDAMRASIAIPTIFTPYKIGDYTLVDGGLARNLPVTDARDMGANFVIGVDVGANLKSADSLNSISSIFNQTVNFGMIESKNRQSKLADLMINPDIKDFSINDFDKARQLIAVGEKAARQNIEALKAIARQQEQVNRLQVEKPPTIKQIYINEITIRGLQSVPDYFIKERLQIEPKSVATQQQILNGIDRIYSTQFFELVTYRLNEHADGTELVIDVNEKQTDLFRVGFRYDSHSQSSLLLHADFRNLLQQGSLLRFNARLGDLLWYNADYIFYFGTFDPDFGIRSQLNYYNKDVQLYRQQEVSTRLSANIYNAELFFGNIFSNTFATGIGLKKEFVHYSNVIPPDALSEDGSSYHQAQALIWVDTFNRKPFPTSGQSLRLQFEYSGNLIYSPEEFTRSTFYWQSNLPIGEFAILRPTLYLGYSSGKDLPIHYRFYLNDNDHLLGISDFMGYKWQEISGSNLHMGKIELQIEPLDKKFLTLSFNAANTPDHWTFNVHKQSYLTGFGLGAGALTAVGPVEITFSASKRHSFIAELNLGYRF